MTELTHPLATVPRDELVARAEADPHRPRFHFVSPGGWLNDPNGVGQWNGTYHLFYQYNPEGAFHHRILWGHATSEDLVNWTDQPVALEPTAGPDADGCWSGVLVNDDGTPTLVYSGRQGERELPCVATGSPDLLTWTKFDANPVIPGPPAGVDITAYRDHCVWREGSRWRQLVGSGIRGRGGTAFLYESEDLRSWTYVGPLFIGDASAGDPAGTSWEGTMWECVDLFRAGTGTLGDGADGGDAQVDALVFSAWDDGATRHPLYWTGRYSGDSFTPRQLHRLDYGGRYFYAPQSFADESGRRVMFGWLQEGRTDAAMVEAGWSGVMSLPRIATLDPAGELVFAPVPEIESLRYGHVRLGPEALSGFKVLDGVDGNQLDLELDLDLEPGSVFRLGILGTPSGTGDMAEETVIEVGCQAANGTEGSYLRLDRTRSSLDTSVDVEELSGPVALPDGRLRLRVIVDHSALEVFANGKPLTARAYPTLGGGSVRLSAVGPVRLRQLDAWRMEDVFDGPRPLFP
ncbi:glycoside hydrolase family 32 protein [Arthrobacter sp. CDRTa11]|uniref:glycoside hydrolase family 32 protein n=1 Tax=Arthrobacter sp. CDRTa11 TaxID=2651199 RepID=UPI002265F3FE|nr:glycoside hydrolase family 32 protein [Arthrobacter sp. CDRTa11]UZX01718.1 glycoside hydrolase family 32 protein [Arthrobacter sp. CDRTa11]